MNRQHLGERLSALIDGELGPAEHESALIHLAKCESCRFEADMMRRLKRRLHGLGEPEPDLDFMGRLVGLSRGDGPGGGAPRGPSEPPPGGAGFGARPPLGSSRPLGGFPGEGPAGSPVPMMTEETVVAPERSDRRRGDRFSHLLPTLPGGRYAVAGFAVATVLLGGAFVAGGEPGDAPVVEPRLSDFAVEHAVTSRVIPVVDTPADPAVAPPGSGPDLPTR
ncbi:anti-sigma factor family protein [Nocardiopsis lambiniae]|uniref:Zf-HC2 domain-containing protein n=1 Tax=Nocardiopsis lambiniae TaxID=3075539 RepID=A0ABU2MG81_9ACTN|nr:zf-HC2 domain-containing protein [Nocardiopsis sp. DSM 44743]MDT0331714.1 zf-HC2 domain-containing protein [Nocardiopsis sp. DSM 44743]